jgi:hypothetical protein
VDLLHPLSHIHPSIRVVKVRQIERLDKLQMLPNRKCTEDLYIAGHRIGFVVGQETKASDAPE